MDANIRIKFLGCPSTRYEIARTKIGADAHIDSLAKKYLDADKYPYRSPSEIRVIYKIKPIAIFGIK